MRGQDLARDQQAIAGRRLRRHEQRSRQQFRAVDELESRAAQFLQDVDDRPARVVRRRRVVRRGEAEEAMRKTPTRAGKGRGHPPIRVRVAAVRHSGCAAIDPAGARPTGMTACRRFGRTCWRWRASTRARGARRIRRRRAVRSLGAPAGHCAYAAIAASRSVAGMRRRCPVSSPSRVGAATSAWTSQTDALPAAAGVATRPLRRSSTAAGRSHERPRHTQRRRAGPQRGGGAARASPAPARSDRRDSWRIRDHLRGRRQYGRHAAHARPAASAMRASVSSG